MKVFNAFKFNVKEHWDNKKLILQMARSEAGKQTVKTSLGIVWLYIRDFTYFFVYVIFRLLVAGNKQVEGMNAILYVILGLVPWIFISDVLNKGSTVIKANKAVVKSIAFPVSILPTVSVVSVFIQKIFNYAVALILSLLLTKGWHVNIFAVIYYSIAMIVVMVGINAIAAAFIAVSGDFQQLYLAIVRVIMYILPVIWSFETISNNTIKTILRINPLCYVIEGFRHAFAGGGTFSIGYTLYFWICTFVLLLIGSYTQYKLSKFYSDLM